MAICRTLFSLPSLLLITAIIVGYYRNEILEHARENYDLCPKIEESVKNEVEIEKNEIIDTSEEKKVDKKDEKPKYWLFGENADEKFKRVARVLEALGIERHNGSLKDEEPHKGWNIMWSDKSYVALNWKEVEYHQKFNHFPGKKNYFLNFISI